MNLKERVRMTARLVWAIAGFSLLIPIMPLHLEAHHSFAAVFDEKATVKLQGTVTKLEWMNPHIWFYLEVKDENGGAVKWQCEGANPNTLLRQGWTRDSLKVGASVEVEGWRARNGTNTCNARSVVVDGKRLFAASSSGQ